MTIPRVNAPRSKRQTLPGQVRAVLGTGIASLWLCSISQGSHRWNLVTDSQRQRNQLYSFGGWKAGHIAEKGRRWEILLFPSLENAACPRHQPSDMPEVSVASQSVQFLASELDLAHAASLPTSHAMCVLGCSHTLSFHFYPWVLAQNPQCLVLLIQPLSYHSGLCSNVTFSGRTFLTNPWLLYVHDSLCVFAFLSIISVPLLEHKSMTLSILSTTVSPMPTLMSTALWTSNFLHCGQ